MGVDLLAAASLPVAAKIDATAAAIDTEDAAGAVVATAAAGSEAEAAAADVTVTVHLVRIVRRQSPLPERGHLMLRRLRPRQQLLFKTLQLLIKRHSVTFFSFPSLP